MNHGIEPDEIPMSIAAHGSTIPANEHGVSTFCSSLKVKSFFTHYKVHRSSFLVLLAIVTVFDSWRVER